MTVCVVGSGGKTTLIKKLAHRFRKEGKTVLVTTSTHMFREPDTLVTDDAAAILRAMAQRGWVMAGVGEGAKIRALSPETYAVVCARADVVLVEADGSKGLPLKFPNATEPVIPEHTDEIIVVWGPHGLGKPAREVCHRLELVLECLGIDGDTPITRRHVARLLEKGYLTPLAERYPCAKIVVYPDLPQ